MRRSSKGGRWLIAAGLAMGAHLLALVALGGRIPLASVPQTGPEEPPLQLTILHPERPASQAAGGITTPLTSLARPSIPTTSAPSPIPPPVSAPPAPSGAQAERPPDCEPEDLPLLTEAERTRCRNQIDADKARQAARAADDRAARQVARAQNAPPMFRMDPDKEASYDAAAHPALEAPHLPKVGPGVACSHATFPLLSGVDINPDLFEKKHKQEHKPTYGHATCAGHL